MNPQALRAHTFQIRLDCCVQTLSRLIGLFAQRDEALSAITLVSVSDVQHLTMTTPGLSWDHAQLVAEKMRQLVTVSDVTVRRSDEHLVASCYTCET